jgi:phage FluMu gp28-like protein
LWHKNPEYSRHKITIHDAKKDGLPIDVDQLRAGLDDPEGWAQEYECEFMDAAAVLLPYELIALCESAEARRDASLEFWGAGGRRRLVMGIDYGRKRDLSVAWTAELVGDVLHTREVFEMSKMSTPDQIEMLRHRLAAVQRVCLDYTGPGTGMGDYLVKEFGEWNPEADSFGKVELCQFTNSFKQDVFPKLKMAFENRRLRVPIHRDIREDLHSMHRVTTASGLVTYRAPHTDDGHADRCTALALALRAAGNGFTGMTTVTGLEVGAHATRFGTFRPRRLLQEVRS